MNKYVIFTALVGAYDEIHQPEVIDERFDYLLFSNDIKEKQVGVWQVRPFNYQNPVKTKIARWVKTHPEQLLPEYEASLWIDSNIIIVDDIVYKRFGEIISEGSLVATMRHSLRQCAYEEMFEILCCGFEHEDVTLKWGQVLRKEKYPRNNGLCETGVFFRKHSVAAVQTFDKLWWDIIERYSRRDQYSVNYALWKCGLGWTYYISSEESVFDSHCFKHVEHKGHIPQRVKLGRGEAWLIRYYRKHLDERERIEALYYRIYGMRFPAVGAFVAGQVFRLKHLLFK